MVAHDMGVGENDTIVRDDKSGATRCIHLTVGCGRFDADLNDRWYDHFDHVGNEVEFFARFVFGAIVYVFIAMLGVNDGHKQCQTEQKLGKVDMQSFSIGFVVISVVVF